MKNKKGFTLIELLAVIVILAIIALIAVPVVLNMINNAKKGAAVSSAYGYIESIENYQALAQINSNEILKEGHYNVATKTDLKDSEGNVIKSVSKINSLVKMKGKKPSAGTIDIASNQQVSGATLCINGFVVRYLNQKSEVIADDCGDMDLITDLAVEKEGWQTERKLTINYPEGNYKYYYKVSGKAKVNDALIETNKELEATNPQVLMLEENQTVETWIIKNGKKIAITTYVENMIDQIVPILPDATATSGYPMLTLLGVSTNISLDISNATEQSGTTPYYSVDDGNNWKKYTGKTNIDATSIKVVMRRDLSKIESEIVDVDISSENNSDALGIEAYDNEGVATSYKLINGQKKIAVDELLWGKKIKLSAYIYSSNVEGTRQEPNHNWIKFEKENEIETYKYFVNTTTYIDEEILIPEGTKYIIFESGAGTSYYIQIKDIYYDSAPTYKDILSYPTIKSTGIVNANKSTVKLTFINQYSTHKCKIDNGEWNSCSNSVDVPVGKKLYAKGIDSLGRESMILEYSSISPSDGLGEEAYDSEGVSTSYKISTGQKKIAVDSSMWGKDIKLTAYIYSSGVSGTSQVVNHNWIKFEKENEIETYKYLLDKTTYTDEKITIPEGTKYIIFESGTNTSYYFEIKDIAVSN